ncbi:MAG: hypothetical protein OXJ90_13550, partial [Spirochaetaceae bacterium]|nr:hypothetical protein [Spirochaetaceae bacterium]
WYSPFCIDHRSHGMTLEQRRSTRYTGPPDREMALCYATSRDGIAWQKPELGLVDYRGSRANNIVLRGPHGAGVVKDAREADPARRYKMFTSLGEQEQAVAFSADGIRWSRFHPCPAVNPYQVDGTHYHALWAEERGEYVGFTRLRDPRSTGAAAVGGIRGAWPPRQVGRTASTDFLHWSPATAVLEGTDENLQIYSMPVFRHGSLYLGLPAIHDQHTDRVWTELAWSPDTVTWHRVCPGSPLIANANLTGSHDWGCAYAAAYPVILHDEIRLYYGASNYQHTSWRDGFLCLATLRPDGFAYYEQTRGDRPATVVTAPLTWSGAALRVTADVSPIGSLDICVLEPDTSRPLAQGQVTRTATDGAVTWSNPPAGALTSQPVRLRFTLNGARLYSFSLH